jgi:hypothetical protein
MFKRCLLAASLALAAGAAAAAPLLFDPTGLDATTGSFTVDRLDWDPSGVLAVGGNAAVSNFLNGGPAAGNQFTVLTHATLAGGSLNNVGVFATTGQPYEITAVVGFKEKVIAATLGNGITTSGTADFQFVAGDTFVRLYYGAPGFYAGAKNANQLLGTGFNDGHLIFDSTVSTVGGSFSTTFGVPIGDLDQTGNGNQWGVQDTVTGSGVNTTVTIDVAAPSTIDTDFFKNSPLLKFLFENVSLNTPFTTTDPSYAFTELANTLYDVTTDGGATSTLGPINGGFSCPTGPGSCVASGPDFMFQTDVNSSVQATVPEPNTLALVGLAMAGLGFGVARRRHR